MRHRSTLIRSATSALFIAVCSIAPAPAAGNDAGAVVDHFFDAYRSADAAAMLAMYSPDAVFEDVAQRHRFEGAEQLQAFLGSLVGVHTAMYIREQRRLVDGHRVVVDYLYTGTLSGAAMSLAMGKEGCRDTAYEIPVTSWYEVEGDKIVRHTDFIDLATLLEVRQRVAGTAGPGG